MTQPSPRVLSVDVVGHPLDREPLAADLVREGDPTAGTTTLDGLGGVEVGLWEHTPGTSTDTEADEVFVVLTGDATLRFGDGESVELRPGVAVRLHAGEETTWVVRETLRKIWIA